MVSDFGVFEPRRLMLCHHILAGDVFPGSKLAGPSSCTGQLRALLNRQCFDCSERQGWLEVAGSFGVDGGPLDRPNCCGYESMHTMAG